MKNRKRLPKMLLVAAASLGASQGFAANPVFTGLSMNTNGKITGSVQDADSPNQPLRVTFTVDGNTASNKTIFVTGAFTLQLPATFLNNASHQVSILAENANLTAANTATTATVTNTLSMPANTLPALSSVAVSATGKVTGTVTDANVATGKTTLTLTIDGVLANREVVTLGTAFALQMPLSYLNGSSHSIKVEAEDANIPGLFKSQTLTKATTAPANNLPTVSFEVRSNGRVYGTATDPDSPTAKLEILMFVDGGTTPVGIVGLATPQFEMAVPGAIFGAHTITLKVEDANIPLAFAQSTSPSVTIDEQFNDSQKSTVDAGVDNNGLITGTVSDVDAPEGLLRVRDILAATPIGVVPANTSPDEGAVLVESVYTLAPVRRAFRTAAEQDLYGNRVPRIFALQIPLTGTSRNFSTGSYNAYVTGNESNLVNQSGRDIIGFPSSIQRSLMVNDIAVLRAGNLFSFQKTLAQLNPGGGTQADRAAELAGQLWKNEIEVAKGGTCTTLVDQNPVGAPNICRPKHEGAQLNEAGVLSKYVPIALVNRFDLIKNPSGVGAVNCGQYRIEYAREDSATRRNFVIFEAILANPDPTFAQTGCLAIQQKWDDQRRIADPMERARQLEAFFYQGMQVTINGVVRTVPPVISRAHFMSYGATSNGIASTNGQIRTNQFLNPTIDLQDPETQPQPWVLKEFKLIEGGVVQGRVGENPIAKLLETSLTTDLAIDFRKEFIGPGGDLLASYGNLKCLMVDGVDKFNFNLPFVFNNGQSFSSTANANENDFVEHANVGGSASYAASLPTAMQTIRNQTPSCATTPAQVKCQITPQQVLNRATARTCGGCHQPRLQNVTVNEFDLAATDAIGPGQSWPLSLTNNLGVPTFVHVNSTADDDAKRFNISTALSRQFLPSRAKQMRDYIVSNGTSAPLLPAVCEPPLDTLAPSPH